MELVNLLGWKVVFFAWHFLWGMFAIGCYLAVNWIVDQKIVERSISAVWNVIKSALMGLVIGVLSIDVKRKKK